MDQRNNLSSSKKKNKLDNALKYQRIVGKLNSELNSFSMLGFNNESTIWPMEWDTYDVSIFNQFSVCFVNIFDVSS